MAYSLNLSKTFLEYICVSWHHAIFSCTKRIGSKANRLKITPHKKNLSNLLLNDFHFEIGSKFNK